MSGSCGNQADRREVLARIVAGVRIKRRVDGERASAAEPKGVAVGRSLGDLTGADRTAGTTAVFNHQRLAERLAHGLSHCTRQHVVASAGRVGND